MRKILLVLLSGLSVASFASSLDMDNLYCGGAKSMSASKTASAVPATGYKLTAATTLADVQKSCLIKKQTTSKGRYEVKFTNSATGKTVSCFFASNTPTATLNSCE